MYSLSASWNVLLSWSNLGQVVNPREKLWRLMQPWFCSFRLWRFMNHLLTYLLTYLIHRLYAMTVTEPAATNHSLEGKNGVNKCLQVVTITYSDYHLSVCAVVEVYLALVVAQSPVFRLLQLLQQHPRCSLPRHHHRHLHQTLLRECTSCVLVAPILVAPILAVLTFVVYCQQ